MRATVETQKDAPPQVAMPVPFALPERTGIDSLLSNGIPVLTRLHSRDVPLVDAEARALGVSRAHFMRWAVLHLAMELNRRRTGKRKDVTL